MTDDLLAQLLDPDPAVDEDAVDAAAGRALAGDREAADALRDVVLHFERFPISTFERTLNRLYAFADASLEPAMLRALENGVSAPWYLTAACGRAGFRGAVPYALALLDSHVAYERTVGCEVLGVLGAHEAVPTLVDVLGDTDHRVRESAAAALADLGGSGAALGLRRELVEPRFALLGYVSNALGAIEPDQTTWLLDQAASPDTRTRYWAVRALGRTGSDLVHEPLLVVAADPAEETAAIANGSTVASAARSALKTWQRVRRVRAADTTSTRPTT
ncbi:HEAT repeat domain-containing protein [Oerskovia merdavium]|uniref:HEAT repeat domain-containing protein n=1 Tax=Oerskovia merdavium TaxID=2762227 RepID=A0ABR8U097_9CELL|nr:HEAT repeat domain-containing protein [Oerskovia merdavium]MBD7981461.1 HEAT repeat domain-containing protein [Oerskovia merdavium]